MFFVVGMCVCSSCQTPLPNSVYNIRLGEFYTESSMIQNLNKDSFGSRNFRVLHKGDAFPLGMYDTFFVSERDGNLSYSCFGNINSKGFSFLDCIWKEFDIDVNRNGKLTYFGFSKSTTLSSSLSVFEIKSDYNILLHKLHNLYGDSEDVEENGKKINIWSDSATCLTIEYIEILDCNNESDAATLWCKVSLKDKGK